MTNKLVRFLFTGFLLATSAAVRGQPATAPTDPIVPPRYPVPYQVPTIEGITQILDRVRDRLETATGSRIINARTKQPIDDLSRPDPDAILDRGPDDKFAPYSYPMGVVYSGMLSTAAVTGDKKYSDFVARRLQFFADNLSKLSSWPSEGLRRNPFRNMIRPGNL